MAVVGKARVLLRSVTRGRQTHRLRGFLRYDRSSSYALNRHIPVTTSEYHNKTRLHSTTAIVDKNNTKPCASSNITTSITTELPPTLDIKYVDSRYDEDKDSWEYEDTANAETPAEHVVPIGSDTTKSNAGWEEYCFVVVRKYSRPPDDKSKSKISFSLIINSPYLRAVCKEVMAEARDISWLSEPLELDPQVILPFVSKFEIYERNLAARTCTEAEARTLDTLRVFLEYMRKNYSQTLARISSLVSHGEITFDLLYTLLVPGTIIVKRCTVTRETRALCLTRVQKRHDSKTGWNYTLTCESLEEIVKDEGNDRDIGWSDDGTDAGKQFCWVPSKVVIQDFDGVVEINKLNAYPLQYDDDPAALTAALIARGRKWAALNGTHHVHYHGSAGRWEWVAGGYKLRRHTVRSRIMVDKSSFALMEDDYEMMPTLDDDNARKAKNSASTLTDDELLLASPIVYGFSLADRKWLEYNVKHITPIEWNDEAFARLDLPTERKTLLRSLIQVHGQLDGTGAERFDDFVQGKGQGLVINLFGPPGVGKTLSAEATSEYLHRPLYVVGSGDLGITAKELDEALSKALELATRWNAVLLIDEADVFMEQRTMSDLQRNAMVAVFLRHVEYYRGILFLTTNRIATFDEAFLSRIHVALHFKELSVQTKARIWLSFLDKAGVHANEISDELVMKLAQREINGRQIKNACRTAASLAVSRGEKLGYEHLEKALGALDEFLADMEGGKIGFASNWETHSL